MQSYIKYNIRRSNILNFLGNGSYMISISNDIKATLQMHSTLTHHEILLKLKQKGLNIIS